MSQRGFPVKIEIDPASDLVTVNLLSDVPVSDLRETEGMLFGYAADRRIVRIEIRGAKNRINAELLKLIDPAFARSAAWPKASQRNVPKVPGRLDLSNPHTILKNSPSLRLLKKVQMQGADRRAE
jgi:hypothetical protein